VAGILVFGAALCVYLATASPAIGWLDSPEFVAASVNLGVPHSPGHPLPVLLGHLAGLIPVGDQTFRINAASGLAGAGAATALWAAGRTLLGQVAPELSARVRSALAAAVALAFALSWASWFQAVRAEVYALESLLLVGAMACAIAWEGGRHPRWLLLGALFGGLAAANHHLIAATVLVPAAALVLARGRQARPSARATGAAAALAMIGLASFLYLPVRSARHPEPDWGAPHTAERFAWTVSARAFQKSVGAERPTSMAEDAGQIAVALADDSSVPLFVLGLVGLYAGLRRRPRALFAFLGGVVALGVVARALIGFEPHTPDHHGYLLPAIAALMLLALAGVGALACTAIETRPGWRRGVVAAALVLMWLTVPLQATVHGPSSELVGAGDSDRVAEMELARLPPRAVLMPSYFETSYRLEAMRALEHARPDVALLDLGFLTYPGTAGEDRRRYPTLAPVIDAPLKLGRPLPLAALAATRRPVYVQLSPELDAATLTHALPVGPFALLAPETPTPAMRAAAEKSDAAWRAAAGAALAHPVDGDRDGVRNTLLWHDFNRLRFYCRDVKPTAWTPPKDGLLGGDCKLSELPE